MPIDPETLGAVEAAIAGFVETTPWEAIPEAVRHQARRAIVNILATGFAGAGEIDVLLAALRPFSGPPSAGLVGRAERVDAALAAFLNAATANVHDFDDTHTPTIVHPTAPVALAETRPVSGRALLRAFVLGAEVECRLGNALTPAHYARGWHVTSTCGPFGAALGVGALLGLDRRRLIAAISAAAAQAAGLVETLGTMAKSVSVGNAARGGLLAALLAQAGLDGPAAPLSGTRGFARVFADPPDLAALVDGLGARWEFGGNTYKPYPVGVVLNPVIDACLRLRGEGLAWDDTVRVTLRGHPLLRQRTDRPDATTGRESQVSAQHAIAVALKTGAAPGRVLRPRGGGNPRPPPRGAVRRRPGVRHRRGRDGGRNPRRRAAHGRDRGGPGHARQPAVRRRDRRQAARPGARGRISR